MRSRLDVCGEVGGGEGGRPFDPFYDQALSMIGYVMLLVTHNA